MTWNVGRFHVGIDRFWVRPSFHREPCCVFWLEIGPIEVGMVKESK